MSTGIITAAWRGFGLDQNEDFVELKLGYISFAFVRGTLWQQHTDLRKQVSILMAENEKLKNKLRWGN